MERDDIIEYSLDAHHSEAEGRRIRKNIWWVTGLLTLITVVEVVLGAYWRDWFPTWWESIKTFFIVLTMIKAGYIVAIFMHLGDERKSVRSVILLPYILFIVYLIFIAVWESNYVGAMLQQWQ